MKKLLLTTILLSLIACSSPQADTVEAKRELLAEKKDALRELQTEIDDLTKAINKLDPPKQKAAVAVESMTITPASFERYVEIQGRVEADDIVNVSSEIGGRIEMLMVKEGDYVKKGQLIASTDMSTLEKQIDEIETNLELAKTVYERQKRLWDQNIGSEIQYLQAKANKESLEKSLSTLKTQIGKKNIYAPINGYVDREFLQAGETASPGMPIIQILNTARVKVVADAQENFLKSINKGDSVHLYFPALDLQVDETISQIGRTIDLNNRTFEIEIATSSQNGQLKPNLLSVISFKDYEASEVLSIPLDLIQQEVNGRKYVFVAKEKEGEKIARKAYIELGESNTKHVIIESGLTEGDQIITLGAKSISNGDRIKLNS